VVFLDFDGTISRVDVVDAILDRYADPAWERVEREWKAGRIGSRACLAAQIALVTASEAEVGSLLSAIEIDPGFPPLPDGCGGAGSPVHIVSDGFDYCIGRILKQLPAAQQARLSQVTINSSHLEPAGPGEPGRWRTAFRFMDADCAHGCATCKPAVMEA